MKKAFITLAALLVCGAAIAQSVDWTIRQVRDPVQQVDKLNGDMKDIDGRLDDVEALGITNTAAAVTVGSLTTTGKVAAAEATIDGKYGAVGPNATAGLMIATGSTTNGGTVTWGAVFGTQTPIVATAVIGAATNGSAVPATARVTSRNATNAVIYCDGFIGATKATVNVIAIGTRP